MDFNSPPGTHVTGTTVAAGGGVQTYTANGSDDVWCKAYFNGSGGYAALYGDFEVKVDTVANLALPPSVPTTEWELVVAGSTLTLDPVSATTPSLAPNAGVSGALAIGENVRLVYLSTTVPARVRLYTSAAKRDADVGRGAVDPTGNHGLVLEAVTSDAQPGVALNPEPKALGLDGNLYYRITSLDDVTGPITFTVEWATVPV